MSNDLATFKSGIKMGMRDAAPFILVVAPFGLLFGVIGTEAGLNLLETMTMTVLVIAGAAQFTAVALWEENAPTVVVLLTALAVNLRMAMYSAALVKHLRGTPRALRFFVGYSMVDQNFALLDAKAAATPDSTWQFRFGYFHGAFFVMSPFWYSFTYIGAVFGGQIPPEYAIDFALPITFLALIGPMLRTVPHYVAAFCSVVFALLLNSVPYGLGLLMAAVLAIICASATEVWLERRGQ
ncbi:MAG: AzlC family ABC transporter permease [Pseudomonadota bacterium]